MTFNIFMTQGVFCFCQYNRIDDLITCKLRSNKCATFRQFLVDEFYFPAVFKCFDPLLVWHVRSTSGEATVARKYTSFSGRITDRERAVSKRLLYRSEVHRCYLY